MSKSNRKINCVICQTIFNQTRLFGIDSDGNKIELNQSRICGECITEKNENVNFEFLGFKWDNMIMTIV